MVQQFRVLTTVAEDPGVVTGTPNERVPSPSSQHCNYSMHTLHVHTYNKYYTLK